MKIEWVKNGQEFELPKRPITVEDEIMILDYMDKNTKDMTQLQKNINEFIETIYHVFHKIDKNITRDIVKQNTTIEELGILYGIIRTKGQLTYNCPHCGKSFLYQDLTRKEEKGNETNFSKLKKDDITETKKTD